MMQKKWFLTVWIIIVLGLLLNAGSIYNYEVKTLRNETMTLEPFKGEVILIVNTASRCSYSSQLSGLEKLYRNYRMRGFTVLGFPTNQFASQEPLEGLQIQRFCKQKYGVTFPIFNKIKVNGKHAHPLYTYLKNGVGGLNQSKMIEWNFTKFLIDRSGHVIRRYSPNVTPKEIAADIEKIL